MYVDKNQVWTLPDEWPLHAASVTPLAYCTAYFSLIMRGHVRCGKTVLIHGSNGIATAATHIALHHGCEVFITTPSLANLPDLVTRFNQLKKGNVLLLSPDFKNELLRKTKGSGKCLSRLAPVLTIFHQCVISYSCSQSNSDGSVLKQSHQS